MMSKTELISHRISECLDRCRAAGFTLATLIQFLDEMRVNGEAELDVQRVDKMMRFILKNILAPADSVAVELMESPTTTNGGKETKVIED